MLLPSAYLTIVCQLGIGSSTRNLDPLAGDNLPGIVEITGGKVASTLGYLQIFDSATGWKRTGVSLGVSGLTVDYGKETFNFPNPNGLGLPGVPAWSVPKSKMI